METLANRKLSCAQVNNHTFAGYCPNLKMWDVGRRCGAIRLRTAIRLM
jgi:hypothetical protein